MKNFASITIIFLVAILSLGFIGAVDSCGGDDDDDDTSDDDTGDDDVSDDDDDDTSDDDTGDDDVSDDDDDDEALPFSCDENRVFEADGKRIQALAGGALGETGVSGAYHAIENKVYFAAAQGRELYLYSRDAGEAASLDVWDGVLIDCMAASPEMMIDGSGYFHLVYADLWNDTLVYATNSSGDWIKSTIDIAGPFDPLNSDDEIGVTRAHAALTLDEQERPHVAYYNFQTRQARYAVLNGTDWEIEVLDNPIDYPEFPEGYRAFGFNPDIEIDAEGNIVVIYSSAITLTALRYWEFDGEIIYQEKSENWSREIFPPSDETLFSTVAAAKLIENPSGNVELVFGASSGEWISTKGAEGWAHRQVEGITKLSGARSVAYDGEGNLHVVRRQRDDGRILTYSRLGPGTDTVYEKIGDLVDESDNFNVDMILTAEGVFVFSFEEIALSENARDQFKIWSKTTSEWTPDFEFEEENLMPIGVVIVGPTIHSFVSVNDGKVIQHWQITDAGASMSVLADYQAQDEVALPTARSVVADQNGGIHVLYQVNTDGGSVVDHFSWDGDNWTSGRFIPSEISLSSGIYAAVDNNDEPHFIGRTDSKLLAYFSPSGPGTWEFELLAADPDHGFATLALDSEDTPHIVYRDELYHYLTLADSEWTDEIVDDETEFGSTPFIAVDSENVPHIVYSSRNIFQVFHTYERWGFAWKDEALTGVFGGQSPDLLIDNSDAVRVVFTAPTPKSDLALMENSSDVWAEVEIDHAGAIEVDPRITQDSAQTAYVYRAEGAVYVLTMQDN